MPIKVYHETDSKEIQLVNGDCTVEDHSKYLTQYKNYHVKYGTL